ncbi:hypothetical protein CYY_006233 [Polysphondylium violaceum]|uniref:Uncharacterized protein n=1 Tax=Polysphondylium violaceum TaxID=133409 RepID=A0A8J4PS82_9MYCE|nr:hypothetical protein CYY_006233 [Polysphondylium violaceum]
MFYKYLFLLFVLSFNIIEIKGLFQLSNDFNLNLTYSILIKEVDYYGISRASMPIDFSLFQISSSTIDSNGNRVKQMSRSIDSGNGFFFVNVTYTEYAVETQLTSPFISSTSPKVTFINSPGTGAFNLTIDKYPLRNSNNGLYCFFNPTLQKSTDFEIEFTNSSVFGIKTSSILFSSSNKQLEFRARNMWFGYENDEPTEFNLVLLESISTPESAYSNFSLRAKPTKNANIYFDYFVFERNTDSSINSQSNSVSESESSLSSESKSEDSSSNPSNTTTTTTTSGSSTTTTSTSSTSTTTTGNNDKPSFGIILSWNSFSFILTLLLLVI